MKNSGFLGLGNDIIEIERIRESIEEFEDKFTGRLFTQKERTYCEEYTDPALRYAGRFAAKEAVAKALGTGFGQEFKWLDIEILNDERGKPIVHFTEDAKNRFQGSFFVSISHCNQYASAVAIWVDDQSKE